MAFLMLALFNSKVCYAKTTDERPTTYLVKGDSIKLKTDGATINSWRSSNNSVVSVSQKGVIKAKKVGEATVKAMTKNKCYCLEQCMFADQKINSEEGNRRNRPKKAVKITNK